MASNGATRAAIPAPRPGSAARLFERLVLLKYNWIEKSVVATAVTIAYWAGEVPPRLMQSVILTNWLWIPAILYYDLAVRRLLRRAAVRAA